ncbi:unnamed protein product [Durusdinium trenchii]|uniref:Uncharacterized protein n=1 Tax=Durusdinium trenchii TaxID=1381693 RepID=A0ABP0SCZ2_9DINO
MCSRRWILLIGSFTCCGLLLSLPVPEIRFIRRGFAPQECISRPENDFDSSCNITCSFKEGKTLLEFPRTRTLTGPCAARIQMIQDTLQLGRKRQFLGDLRVFNASCGALTTSSEPDLVYWCGLYAVRLCQDPGVLRPMFQLLLPMSGRVGGRSERAPSARYVGKAFYYLYLASFQSIRVEPCVDQTESLRVSVLQDEKRKTYSLILSISLAGGIGTLQIIERSFIGSVPILTSNSR